MTRSPRLEKKIGKAIQGDIPLSKHPFRDLVAGFPEAELLHSIKGMIDNGIIRKFSAILRHERAGFNNNAMVVWAVPPEQVEKVGALFAGFSEITHCYERAPLFDGKYNLFTMIHLGPNQDRSFFRQLAEISGVNNYEILESIEEFKKTSMEYYS